MSAHMPMCPHFARDWHSRCLQCGDQLPPRDAEPPTPAPVDATRAALEAKLRPMFEAIHAYQQDLVREVRQQAIREAIGVIRERAHVEDLNSWIISPREAIRLLEVLRDHPARQEEG